MSEKMATAVESAKQRIEDRKIINELIEEIELQMKKRIHPVGYKIFFKDESDGKWYWYLQAQNGHYLAQSAIGYTRKDSAVDSMNQVLSGFYYHTSTKKLSEL